MTRRPQRSTLVPYTTLFRSLRDENAHNDKSVHGVLNPTYQAGLRRDAVQPDIEAERKKRDEIEAGKSYCSRRFGGATCDDKSAQIYARFDKNEQICRSAHKFEQRSEERFSRNAETDLVCRLLLEKKKKKEDEHRLHSTIRLKDQHALLAPQ